MIQRIYTYFRLMYKGVITNRRALVNSKKYGYAIFYMEIILCILYFFTFVK